MAESGDLVGVRLLGCSRRTGLRAAFERPSAPAAQRRASSLMFITGGAGLFRFREGALIARAGDAVIWEDGELSERSGVAGAPLSYYMVLFVPFGARGHSGAGRIGLPRVSRPRDAAAFRRRLRALLRLSLDRKPGWLRRASVLLLDLLPLPEAREREIPYAEPGDIRPDDRISDVLEYIGRNYKKRLEVQDLARIVRLHPVYFNRLFRKKTGVTPHRYLLEKKIQKAKDFLQYYHQSLTTTALELGFHDYSHFSRIFRRLTGETPGRFVARTRS